MLASKTHSQKNHMPRTFLASFSAWALVALGLAHISFGVIKFQAPLLQAVSSGFVGMFSTPEISRTAFWFVLFGLPLVLAGHVAVRAARIGDLVLLKIIGGYVFVASLLGVAAFPASPFWASLVVSALLVASGFGFKRARDA